jgi:nucleotide-binding universal stress UspA family protein
MNERMKVLVAYDGSTYADAALEDLRRAGLPREAEALIVSVSDGLVNPSSSIADIAGSALTSRRVTSAIALAREQAAQALEEAKEFAAKAGDRVRSYFPDWEVRAEGIAGTPSQELIQRVDKWKPDLIVVGSQGRSALGRFFLGSVSKAVATEANCSVRVVRPAVEKRDDAQLRIIVGVDGSPGAALAVRAVGTRLWPEGTEVHIIAVDDGVSPTRVADIHPKAAELITGDNEGEAVKARVMLAKANEELRALALNVSTVISEGDPQTVLIEEARKWAADCIFVGALGFDTAHKRSGLGSVAMGLVTNAPCAVEIVR